MITHKVCKHCKRKDVIVTKLKGKCINLSPLLILEMGNLKVAERDIERCIPLTHISLTFSLTKWDVLLRFYSTERIDVSDLLLHMY